MVTIDGVLKCLRPIWNTKPETASRVRGRIERVLDAAKAAGLRSGENPARWRGHLEMILPKPTKLSRGHHAAMPYVDVPAFIAKLQSRDATSARMLELVILTAARSGEVRNMREGDLIDGVWTIPASQMKAKREHRVPLTSRAVEILSAYRRQEAPALLFPNSRNRAHSDMVFAALLKRMGVGQFTTHGFRASFKTWAENETTHQRETIEAALAHVIGDKAEQAYRRSDMLEKRRALLHDWADFLASGSASI
jgi:integrase